MSSRNLRIAAVLVIVAIVAGLALALRGRPSPIIGAFQFRFATAGFLEVGQVIPANGAQDVQAGAAITVLFNRPVVPLTVVEQQNNAPQPLSFTPAIQGKGEWLNTAIYVFHP